MALLLALFAAIHLVDAKLQDLLVATARGSFALQDFLRESRSKALLSARDEFGFSSLTVAAYNGDWQSAEELLKHGALVTSGEITVFMGETGRVKVGSVVELMVRRSSMLILLGTGVFFFFFPKDSDMLMCKISNSQILEPFFDFSDSSNIKHRQTLDV